MIRHQQEMPLSEPEANHRGHTEIFLIQMKDNCPTDMEDPHLATGKTTVIINKLECCPL
jgi:hypothetical protein